MQCYTLHMLMICVFLKPIIATNLPVLQVQLLARLLIFAQYLSLLSYHEMRASVPFYPIENL
jgi:hypothetical protein